MTERPAKIFVTRRIPQAHAYMTEERYRLWGPNLFLGSDVSPGGTGLRKTLGVVGFGRIGQAVADARSGRRTGASRHEALAHLRGERAPHVVNPDVYGTEAYRRRRAGRRRWEPGT